MKEYIKAIATGFLTGVTVIYFVEEIRTRTQKGGII